MRVLIAGGGGREHALAWAICRSPQADAVFCAPGNGGTDAIATNVAISPMDKDAILAFVRSERIDFTVIGPEAPLAAGLANRLAEAGHLAFGPGAEAARLESSKGFCKTICRLAGAPTAKAESFHAEADALAWLDAHGAPIVVKADGLAAGKGVVVAESAEEARSAIKRVFSGVFGKEAGASLLLEERLAGTEASFFVLCDGEKALPLASAQDYKRAFDGDRGPNTGGMGAISPHPLWTPSIEARIMDGIIRPCLRVMAARGTPYRGVLYAGLMLDGESAKLIEFNARFGDPECQILMLRLRSDPLTLLYECACGRMAEDTPLEWDPRPAVTVTLAAKGYPERRVTGDAPVSGLEEAHAIEGVTLFHAGTKREKGAVRAHGGRVLNVCALGQTLREARARAYDAISHIRWEGGFWRGDIGVPPPDEGGGPAVTPVIRTRASRQAPASGRRTGKAGELRRRNAVARAKRKPDSAPHDA